MKRIVIMCLVLLGCMMTSSAQEFRLGALVGLNYDMPEATTGKIGAQIGVKGELGLSSLSEKWYVDMAALLSLQRWKDVYTLNPKLKEETRDFAPVYLKVPLHVGYRFHVGTKTSLFVSVGPYISFGLFGNATFKRVSASDNSVTKSKFPVFKERFTNGAKFQENVDWGVGARVGSDFGEHFQVSFGFDKGLRRFARAVSETKHDVFSLSCGYMF
uniref:Outer membrane protein beta-barrel domain-containing protein n=2 Tax=unclassified Prevotella TaxID=2638335 RepID=A0AB33JNM4_9BACT